MSKKKTIIAAIVLLLVLLVGGAIAYFTDTDNETNTFTIGNVKIDLEEEHWNSTNAQGILPGATVAKDPKITNTGTAQAFMFMKITEPCYDGQKVFTLGSNDAVNSGWVAVGTERSCAANTGVSTATTVYAYGSASAMSPVNASASTPTLFDTVTLKPTLTKTDLTALVGGDLDNPTNPVNIVVNAYGIQADNVTGTPSAIWTANFNS